MTAHRIDKIIEARIEFARCNGITPTRLVISGRIWNELLFDDERYRNEYKSTVLEYMGMRVYRADGEDDIIEVLP